MSEWVGERGVTYAGCGAGFMVGLPRGSYSPSNPRSSIPFVPLVEGSRSAGCLTNTTTVTTHK